MTGMTIPEIIKDHGWDGFREQEAKLLKNVIEKKSTSTVFACGGGTRHFFLILYKLLIGSNFFWKFRYRRDPRSQKNGKYFQGDISCTSC